MTGQTLAVTLLATLGVGFCAGLLTSRLIWWWEERRADRLRAEWEIRYPRVTEDDFARLVNERDR